MHPTALVRDSRSRLILAISLTLAVLAVSGAATALAAGPPGRGHNGSTVSDPGTTIDPSQPATDPVATDPNTSVSGCPSTVDPTGGALRVAPELGILDPIRAGVDHYVVSGDGTSVEVYFWGGVDACYGLADAQALWRRDGTLDIQILEGRRPGVDQPCIDIALLKVVTVQLASDLPLPLDQ